MRFTSRESAGRELADMLREYVHRDTVVLAVPRGGVVVAVEVARALHAPLDLIIVHKISHPASREYAVGALAENGRPVYSTAEAANLDEEWQQESEKAARHRIQQQRSRYFEDTRDTHGISGKIVILVDDGLATGLTMKAAVSVVQEKQPKLLVVATPVASRESIDVLGASANRIISLVDPIDFKGSVSAHYVRFPQIDDETVVMLMERSQAYDIQRSTALNS